jgi:hypothetical protein
MKHALRLSLVTFLVALVATGLAGLGPLPDADAKPKQLFVIGNSISHHGPLDAVGWSGDWGMAASEPKKDFISQLHRLLEGRAPASHWKVTKADGGNFERGPGSYQLPDHEQQSARNATVVVVELGDNFPDQQQPIQSFAKGYADLLNKLKPSNGTLLCVTTWWHSEAKDQVIQRVCNQVGGILVDISALKKQPRNMAGKERAIMNDGVAAHPGDAGMLAIAQAILDKLPRRLQNK